MKRKRSEQYISITHRGPSWRARVRVAPFSNSATFDTEADAWHWASTEKARQILARRGLPLTDIASVSDVFVPETPVVNTAAGAAVHCSANATTPAAHPMLDALLSTVLKDYVRKVSPRKASWRADRSRVKKLIAFFWQKRIRSCSLDDFERYIDLRRKGYLGQGRRNLTASSSKACAGGPSKHRDASLRGRPDDGTIRHEIILFRRALKDWWKRNGLLESHGAVLTTHPCFLVDLPRKARARKRRLDDDEVARLLNEVEKYRRRHFPHVAVRNFRPTRTTFITESRTFVDLFIDYCVTTRNSIA